MAARTAIRLTIEASVSSSESTSEASIATEPVVIPAYSFTAARKAATSTAA